MYLVRASSRVRYEGTVRTVRSGIWCGGCVLWLRARVDFFFFFLSSDEMLPLLLRKK